MLVCLTPSPHHPTHDTMADFHLGLFTPGKRGQFRRGQYDLGNPRGFTGGFHGGLNDGMSGDVRRLQDENAMLHERLAAFNMNV